MSRRRAGVAGTVATFALIAAAASVAVPAIAEPFIVGIGRSIRDPAAAAGAMRSLGVRSMRVDARWDAIETSPGRYRIPGWLETAVDSARDAGIEPLLILAYGHPLYGGDKPRTPAAIAAFARYAVYVTRHFQGRVRYFDLWNEWNTPIGRTTPGTPDDYIALARRVYPAMKAESPEVVVLSGGITSAALRDGWLERFIALGGLEFVDGLSVHPYNYRQLATPEQAVAELDRVHELTRAAGRPLPLYVTEMGYPSYGGRGGVSPEVAAAYLARFVLLASTRPHVVGVWWYCLRDQGRDAGNKEHHFGVLDADLQPKPAAAALRDVTALLDELGRFRDTSSAVEVGVTATRADGAETVLVWRADAVDGALVRDVAERARSVRAALPARGR